MPKEIHFEDVIQEVMQGLEKVPEKCEGDGDGRWTEMVKEAVMKVARDERFKRGSKVATTHPKGANEGEWLFDLTWYREETEWRIQKLILVMESEWNMSLHDQQRDFQKLIVAKAQIKLFVFQQKIKEDIDEKLKEFSAMIHEFVDHNQDEMYLFAGLALDSRQFQFYCLDGAGQEKVLLKN